MENKKVEKVMYMKFNNNDKRGAILEASRKGVVVIDRPFKEVLKEEVNKTDISTTSTLVKDSVEEVDLIWQPLILRNKLRINGGRK